MMDTVDVFKNKLTHSINNENEDVNVNRILFFAKHSHDLPTYSVSVTHLFNVYCVKCHVFTLHFILDTYLTTIFIWSSGKHILKYFCNYVFAAPL